MRVASLTFLRSLRDETHHRLKGYGNFEAFTFHGMGSQLRGSLIPNDVELLKWRRDIVAQWPRLVHAPFDILVFDEYQDCSEIIFWLSCITIIVNQQRRMGEAPRIVVLGDERQSIYHFRDADSRFLTRAKELLSAMNTYPWVAIPLHSSFRLSQESVRFVNDGYLSGEQVITSSKQGPKPIILQCDPFDSKVLAERLLPMINEHGVENTAILAPSVRRNFPLRLLTNLLAKKHRIPIAVSTNDEMELAKNVIRGKMCVSTIHQFKGRERSLIIVFGMDDSYFEYFGHNLPHDRCPNEVYVALTRGKQQLVLVHDYKKEYMPFVSVEALHKTADIYTLVDRPKRIPKPDESTPKKSRSIGVSELVRHMRAELIYGITTNHLVIDKSDPIDEIKFPSTVISNRRKGFHEAISDLNGLVTIADCELDVVGTLTALGLDQKVMNDIPSLSFQEYITYLYQSACSYEAKLSGYLPRSIQLKYHAFKEIKPDTLARVRQRLRKQLETMRNSTDEIRFEHGVETLFTVDDEQTVLHGQADIVGVSPSLEGSDHEKVDFLLEVKLTSRLSDEHAVQAGIYSYLMSSESTEVPHTILYNVRNGEKWVITPRHGREGLRSMIEAIVRDKMRDPYEMSDDEFDKKCEETRQEVLRAHGRMNWKQ